MTLGPFLFVAPLALAALAALPVLWWLLRATPPTPKDAELPSLRILDELQSREETPARTPWWILALRLAAAALAILGLAQPIYAPGARTDAAEGPLLLVLDNGWTAAARWPDLVAALDGTLETTGRDTPVHLLLTAPREPVQDPGERFDRSDMGRRLASLEPVAWGVDRKNALARLQTSGLSPARIVWASDGLDDATGAALARDLAAIAPLTVYAASPKGPAAITGLVQEAGGVRLTLSRASTAGDVSAFLSALSADGTSVATAAAVFAEGAREGVARFEIPAAAAARINRFRVIGQRSAGAAWLWDSDARRRTVGLVSVGEAAQPLLSDLHYVRRALEPFSTLVEGELSDLIDAAPDAIVLTDVGRVPETDAAALTAWVENGGALIRFAGPRLAAQEDALTPTPLRRASRALGGALTWDEPQALAPFPDASPFFGLSAPEGSAVRRQVLARPSPELDARTWARLADGSPVITADRRGAGLIVLFHVTAGPDWSDLPYTGVFVELLKRAVASGTGGASQAVDGLYAPQSVLDGFGGLTAPSDLAAPLAGDAFNDVTPSETSPPGFYSGPAGLKAINAAAGYAAAPIENWPAGATLLGEAEARAFPLAGALLAAALSLAAVDLIVALGLAGRLPVRRAAAAGAVATIAIASAPAADAQDEPIEAALTLRFGYVRTGDKDVDEVARLGLQGLSGVLYRRTSVEPDAPDAIDLEHDPLELYPLIYFAVPDEPAPLSETAAARLNAYMRFGGALVIDTRSGDQIAVDTDFSFLEPLLQGLDAPALRPADEDHVIARSFYLIDAFPGRYSGRKLWLESGSGGVAERRGDGVSRLFVGDADWAAAWAADEIGRAIYSVDGGERQREMALRFGVNLVMYVLTGNYKEDQVHIPALLERLGDGDERDPEVAP